MAIVLDAERSMTTALSNSNQALKPTAGNYVLPLKGGGLPTAERVQQEIACVLNKTLSPRLEHWAAQYAKVGHRNMYLWKWCRQGVEITTLGCVMPEFFDEVCDTKVLGVMIDVLLDDLADRGGDNALLERLLTISLDNQSPDLSAFSGPSRAYADFTVEVWQEIVGRASRFPHFADFRKLLDYDYQQLWNVMRYSHLINEDLSLLNLAEHDIYTPHNMHMMVSSTLDLMCSSGFDRSELGKVRDAAWHGQCMGRVGNLVTTWERELGEGDYTSGVYASAINAGDLTIAQLRAGDQQQIRRAIVEGQHEVHFLRRWQASRNYLLSRVPHVRSFDLGKYVAGLERLICLHLGSRGYK